MYVCQSAEEKIFVSAVSHMWREVAGSGCVADANVIALHFGSAKHLDSASESVKLPSSCQYPRPKIRKPAYFSNMGGGGGGGGGGSADIVEAFGRKRGSRTCTETVVCLKTLVDGLASPITVTGLRRFPFHEFTPGCMVTRCRNTLPRAGASWGIT